MGLPSAPTGAPAAWVAIRSKDFGAPDGRFNLDGRAECLAWGARRFRRIRAGVAVLLDNP